MPEEEKGEVGDNGKFKKEILIDNEVMDKFWIEGSGAYYGKPERRMLGTLVYKDHCDKRVVVLMGSENNLIMECEGYSEVSDGNSVDYHEPIRRCMVREILNGGCFYDHKLKEHEEEDTDISEVEDKEAEGTNTMEASPIGESENQEDKMLHNLETENMISFRDRENQESVNCQQRFPVCLPYSGSVSLRSTSSTASAQSFAFPVLVQEWNSSPVKMANADKRQLRKNMGWTWRKKIGWVCCRF